MKTKILADFHICISVPFKNTYFEEYLQTVASDITQAKRKFEGSINKKKKIFNTFADQNVRIIFDII